MTEQELRESIAQEVENVVLEIKKGFINNYSKSAIDVTLFKTLEIIRRNNEAD